ncbi:DUF350 domain-containing protein [Planococcus lenghuensis]|uniref:DUF350 domain-containing protein n=1 Tax=Planococcus lenghuensis TaxID=2213202 RepID=A0A1Q2KUW1_9BACL|nr:DUF350 domain-containing protein [Planococcus lenghuensis]AQQ52008.1 hypothetical protein B0X71_01970 [Planococcus lenghuensis]
MLQDMLNEAFGVPELINSVIYFTVSFLLMVIYIWLFEKFFTKVDDQAEVAKGNQAVAKVLTAKRISLVIIMAAALYENTNPLGVAIWATIGFIIQVAVYKFVELKTAYDMEEQLAKGNIAAAQYLGGWSIATSVLVAFAVIIS